LIAFGIGQETSRVDGAAALAGDDEGACRIVDARSPFWIEH
jgi:hypothetical protein